MKFPKGEGAFVVDGITWDTEENNAVKATRFICGLLTGLGASFQPGAGVVVEAEDMEPQAGMPHFSRGGGRATLACTGYVEREVEVAKAGKYRVDIMAGGSPAAGVYPNVAVALGEKVVGQVQCTTGVMRPYTIEAELPEGVHALRLHFTNDSNIEGEDRNLFLDKAVFYEVE